MPSKAKKKKFWSCLREAKPISCRIEIIASILCNATHTLENPAASQGAQVCPESQLTDQQLSSLSTNPRSRPRTPSKEVSQPPESTVISSPWREARKPAGSCDLKRSTQFEKVKSLLKCQEHILKSSNPRLLELWQRQEEPTRLATFFSHWLGGSRLKSRGESYSQDRVKRRRHCI